MLNQATMDMLTAMKMSAMAAEFANQLKDPAFNELGFEERLGLLVNAEWNRRQSNKLNRFIRSAHFAVSSATVEGIEYHEDRKLDKAQMLRFATCQYIDEGHHIWFTVTGQGLNNSGTAGGALVRESGAQIACRWGWDGDFCIPTTRVRRRISRLSLSMTLLVRMRVQCSLGKRRGCGQKVGQVMLSSQDAAYIPKGCGLLRTT